MMRSLFVYLFLLTGTCSLQAQKAKHVILVSIDGFRPDFYLDAAWPAPNIQLLAKQGVMANGVDGVFPSVTYPSHTTLITGAYPAVHGIYYNTPFQPDGATGIWNSETSLIKTETLWSALRKAGRISASVSWPVSVGAEVDYNIPEAFTIQKPLDRREPTSQYATPKGLFEEVQQKATGQMEAMDLNINYTKMDENLGRIAAYLFKTYRPALLTLHLPGLDHSEHSEGRSGELVKAAIANADRVIGSLLETIRLSGMQDSTAIIVTGDHGFVNVEKSFSPNVLLVQAGLMDSTEAPGRKWKAQFHSGGGSVFLQLKDKNDKATLDQVNKILSNLPDSVKRLFRVIGKEALLQSGADPGAALALAAEQGVSINTRAKGSILSAGKGGAHGYFPDFREIQTGFIAAGAGLKTNVIVPGMKLVDVAPLAARLLEIPFKQGNTTLEKMVLK
jgi:predicted AlkP superfamily pyrophosphatase or phosphodiesterase